MNKAATKMERIKTAAKATRQTGERVAVSCAGEEVAFVPVSESEALGRVEETLDMDAVKRNREQDNTPQRSCNSKKLTPLYSKAIIRRHDQLGEDPYRDGTIRLGRRRLAAV